MYPPGPFKTESPLTSVSASEFPLYHSPCQSSSLHQCTHQNPNKERDGLYPFLLLDRSQFSNVNTYNEKIFIPELQLEAHHTSYNLIVHLALDLTTMYHKCLLDWIQTDCTFPPDIYRKSWDLHLISASFLSVSTFCFDMKVSVYFIRCSVGITQASDRFHGEISSQK